MTNCPVGSCFKGLVFEPLAFCGSLPNNCVLVWSRLSDFSVWSEPKLQVWNLPYGLRKNNSQSRDFIKRQLGNSQKFHFSIIIREDEREREHLSTSQSIAINECLSFESSSHSNITDIIGPFHILIVRKKMKMNDPLYTFTREKKNFEHKSKDEDHFNKPTPVCVQNSLFISWWPCSWEKFTTWFIIVE